MNVLSRPYLNLAAIAAPLQTVLSMFLEHGPATVSAVQTSLRFPLQPYSVNDAALPLILWAPSNAPSLTAFMPSVQSGDYFVVEYANSRFKLPAAAIRATTPNVEWPVNEFICYEGGTRRRVVRAMRDSPRWDFYSDGEVLPCEALESYGRRRVRDRLTREDLLSYLEAWGAPVRSDEFWRSSEPAFTLLRR